MGIEKSKTIKAGISYTIGNYLLKGISLITIPLFARALSTTEYGTVSLFLSYEAILYILIGLAIHSSYNSAKAQYFEMNNRGGTQGYYRYVSATIIMVSCIAATYAGAVLIFAKPLEAALSMDRFLLVLLVCYSWATAVIVCFNTEAGIRYSYQGYLLIAGLNALGNIAVSVLLVFYIFPEHRDYGRILGIVAPALVIAIGICVYYFHRARPEFDRSALMWGIRYSLPIIPHGISQVILNQFDRIMIIRMINQASGGIYSFSYNIYSILAITANSLDKVWHPWFYEKRVKNEFAAIRKVSLLYAAGLSIFVGFVQLISPELVLILGGQKYGDAIYCVIPIVAGGFFAFLYNIPCTVEYYNQKTTYIAFGTVTAAIVNIILNYIFILRYGYVAAAYTTLVTYALYFMFHYTIAWWLEGRSLFHTPGIIICAISVVIVSFLSLLLVHLRNLRFVIATLLLLSLLILEERYLGTIKKQFKRT